MSNRRDTFAKRQREADLKQRALAKQARRLAKRNEAKNPKSASEGGDAVDPENLAIVEGGGAPVVGAPVVGPAVDLGNTNSAAPAAPLEPAK